MGGLGSGRRPLRLCTQDCRSLEIGELADDGRWRRPSEVEWRACSSDEIRGRLAGAVRDPGDSARELILACRYWPTGAGVPAVFELELRAQPGRRIYALCPSCGVRARILYAPPRARSFACRDCAGIVSRRARAGAAEHERVKAAAGPALALLRALPSRTRRRARRRYLVSLPADLARELAAELPLGPEETRLWCLRLRAAGLSYRQIADLAESSKSTVARYCREGKGAIDRLVLVRERLERSWRLPPLGGGLAAELVALHKAALVAGLYAAAAAPREERLVSFGDAE